ncbi:MAG: ATP-binding protein [Bacteroidetes bacterium]|nr:ATP-binding protein [Bacteroidota bacterium]
MNKDTIHTLEHIHNYISGEYEESIYLEFKNGSALRKNDSGKQEIAKDVSAFANSEGGVLIYGIEESNHIASKISPFDGNEFTKEWLEQVINNNIKRRIEGVIIDPIRINDVSKSIYVVRIPKSPLRPHQTTAYRYYKRYNFSVIDMEEHEIRESYLNPSAQLKIVESPQDRAVRIERETKNEDKRRLLIGSVDGLKLAFAELDKILPLLQNEKEAMKLKIEDWHFGSDRNVRHPFNGIIEIMTYAVHLNFEYQSSSQNSASNFLLTILICSGANCGGRMSLEPYTPHFTAQLNFGLDTHGSPCWVTKDKKKQFSTEDLVEEWFGKLIDVAGQVKNKR